MADVFMSVNTGTGTSMMRDVVSSGSSSTAADKIELRLDTTVTRRDALMAMNVFKRWIIQGGLKGAGANLPVQ